jgi:hypothetical protein
MQAWVSDGVKERELKKLELQRRKLAIQVRQLAYFGMLYVSSTLLNV